MKARAAQALLRLREASASRLTNSAAAAAAAAAAGASPCLGSLARVSAAEAQSSALSPSPLCEETSSSQTSPSQNCRGHPQNVSASFLAPLQHRTLAEQPSIHREALQRQSLPLHARSPAELASPRGGLEWEPRATEGQQRQRIHSSAPLCSERAEVRQLVITALGPDRPGLVSMLTKRILECGGNVEQSRMARLAGEFSIIMLTTVDASVPRIAEELRKRLLEVEGLQITTRWAKDDRAAEKKPTRKYRRLYLRGADNPGLVYNVAEYLAGNKINIENLETSTEEAPFGGTMLFTMEGVIAMPIDMPTERLARALDVLQSSLGVQMELRNLDPLRQAEDFQKFWEQASRVGGASRYSMLADSEGQEPGDKGDKFI